MNPLILNVAITRVADKYAYVVTDASGAVVATGLRMSTLDALAAANSFVRQVAV